MWGKSRLIGILLFGDVLAQVDGAIVIRQYLVLLSPNLFCFRLQVLAIFAA